MRMVHDLQRGRVEMDMGTRGPQRGELVARVFWDLQVRQLGTVEMLARIYLIVEFITIFVPTSS